jgi:hypothetical protein
MVVPMVEAMTALRKCALCSSDDNVAYAAAVAMGHPPGCFLAPAAGSSGPSSLTETRILEAEGASKPR